MRRISLSLSLALLTSALQWMAPSPSLAVDPEEPVVEGDYVFSEVVTVDWLQIPVVVRDKKGRPLGSQEGNFSLLVDGKALPVDSFHPSNEQSVQLLFLQDVSGSMATDNKMENSQAVVRNVLNQATQDDTFAIATFASGRTYTEVPFSNNQDVLREAVSQWFPYGQTALHDAVGRIPELEDGLQGGRYAVVLITDGVDNASDLSPQEARSTAWNARLPVYVIELDERRGGTESRSKEPKDQGPLERLAELTGGRYFSVNSLSAAVSASQTLLEDLRHQITLGLVLDAQADNNLHQIEIRFDGAKRAQLRYRPSYFGRQPQAFTEVATPSNK